MTETLRRNDVATSQLLQTLPSEDTLIDALRGCRHTEELEALEQRLRGVSEAPPLIRVDLRPPRGATYLREDWPHDC